MKKILPLFLIGVLLVLIMIAFMGIEDIIPILRKADIRYYILAMGAQITVYLLWLFKWKILTKAINLNVKKRKMLPVLLSGIFVDTVVPSGRIGDIPLRGYMFSRIANVSPEDSFATVAADRALDGISVAAVMLSALIILLFSWNLPLYILILLGFGTALIAFLVILFLYMCLRPDPAMRFVMWIIRRLESIIERFRPIDYVKEKVEEFMIGFSHGSRSILRKKRYVSPALAMAFLSWFFNVVRMYLVFLALGQITSFGVLGIAVTIGIMLYAIPLPGGLGIVEGAYVLVFSAAGIPPEVSLTAALLDRSISFWLTGFISGIGTTWSGHKLFTE